MQAITSKERANRTLLTSSQDFSFHSSIFDHQRSKTFSRPQNNDNGTVASHQDRRAKCVTQIITFDFIRTQRQIYSPPPVVPATAGIHVVSLEDQRQSDALPTNPAAGQTTPTWHRNRLLSISCDDHSAIKGILPDCCLRGDIRFLKAAATPKRATLDADDTLRNHHLLQAMATAERLGADARQTCRKHNPRQLAPPIEHDELPVPAKRLPLLLLIFLVL